jgi:NAD(P)-dependent dehydrogenase (short-subunit alcohol dehydrogenase family)
MDLSNRTILLTGAAQGLGLGLVADWLEPAPAWFWWIVIPRSRTTWRIRFLLDHRDASFAIRRDEIRLHLDQIGKCAPKHGRATEEVLRTWSATLTQFGSLPDCP